MSAPILLNLGTAAAYVAAPPGILALTAPAPADQPILLAAPPAVLAATAPAPTLPTSAQVVDAPPALLGLTAPAPQVTGSGITHVAPADAGSIPSTTPTFLVLVSAANAVDPLLRLTLDDATNPPVLIEAVPYTTGTQVTAIPVTTPLPTGTYTWHAELRDSGVWSDPTDDWTFTISLVAGNVSIDGSWDVDPGQPLTAHLWFVRPPAATPGEEITIYGIGFGPTSAAVTIAGVAATSPVLTAVAPDGFDAYSSARRIDAIAGVAHVEHDQVTVTVPDVPAPGGPLYVEGS